MLHLLHYCRYFQSLNTASESYKKIYWFSWKCFQVCEQCTPYTFHLKTCLGKERENSCENIHLQAADADRDGQVSNFEFPTMISIATAAQKRLGLPAPFQLAEEREKTFAKMDENGDGSIAFDEWLAFFLQVTERCLFDTKKLFSTPQEIIAPVAAL